MRFLLDACVSSKSLSAYLAAEGHDVVSAVSMAPEAPDESVLQIAVDQNRVLITSDNDFGELAFVQRRRHGVIIRLVDLKVDQQIHAIAELLRTHPDELTGPCLITVSRGRVRLRRTQ